MISDKRIILPNPNYVISKLKLGLERLHYLLPLPLDINWNKLFPIMYLNEIILFMLITKITIALKFKKSLEKNIIILSIILETSTYCTYFEINWYDNTIPIELGSEEKWTTTTSVILLILLLIKNDGVLVAMTTMVEGAGDGAW